MVYESEAGSGLAATFENAMDPSLTWSFLTWARTITKLPIFVKVQPLRYFIFALISAWLVLLS